jgi:hypothetical protein
VQRKTVSRFLVAATFAGALLLHGEPTVAQSKTPFVAEAFRVPPGLETREFRLRMLTVNDVVKDYDAVMTSAAHLRGVFPGGTWPDGLTLEGNLIDLGWHQKEFARRTSFAYTVVSPDESRVLGCVYVNPTRKRGYDASVTFWVRQSGLANGLEERLAAAVREWLAKEWPFEAVAYPGRGVDWKAYRDLPDVPR